MRLYTLSLFFLLPCITLQSAQAQTEYSAFIATAFASAAKKPAVKTLWLNNALKQDLLEKFNYGAAQLRLRYWQSDDRTAWILDELGKERPLTVGVVVAAEKITDIRILVYRETRGGEVQNAFFTEQFLQAQLREADDGYALDRHINGITGATLSVRAVEKVAAVALYLHALVEK